MWRNFFFGWVLFAVCGCEEFSISSTSAPSTEYQKITQLLTNLQEKMDLQSTIRETNHRLGILETHFGKNKVNSSLICDEMKLTLEKYSSTVMNLTKETDKKIKKLELQIGGVKNSEEPSSSKSIPENCLEVKERGNNVTGIFLVKPKFASSPFLVVCDMSTRGGGWTLILNRFDGSVDFYLNWQNYKDGFGNLAGELWLGLENVHQLSGYQVNELLVELIQSDGVEAYAHYKHFSVGSEKEGYRLKTLGGFSGSAENSLAYHAGLKFTTKDKDQDTHSTANCAEAYSGAWWYGYCHHSQLTGLYKGATDKYKGVRWGERFYLKKAKMFIRPQLDPTLVL